MCVSVCVDGMNPEVCSTLTYPHIRSFRTMPVLYTRTHTHASSNHLEDSEPTGLKVDIAMTADANTMIRERGMDRL